MKLFACTNCSNIIHFENDACESCGRLVGYRPWADAMVALSDDASRDGSALRFCANAREKACNWLVEPGREDCFCRACRHNGLIPDLSSGVNRLRWRRIEEAKRWMFYSLLQWRLPTPTRQEDPSSGLAFAFLADPAGDEPRVMTGHDQGIVTIALAEADDAERERRRTELNEPYRTLLGQFRHEIGHFYWDLLIRAGGRLPECRAVFGDDRLDYGEALKRHHEQGPPVDWRDGYVSAYATMHPWEDFAETWAHCIHIVDGLETAGSFGVSLLPGIAGGHGLAAEAHADAYAAADADELLSVWPPVAIAMNAINRSMGAADLYPFVLTPMVRRKLAFVLELIWTARRAA